MQKGREERRRRENQGQTDGFIHVSEHITYVHMCDIGYGHDPYVIPRNIEEMELNLTIRHAKFRPLRRTKFRPFRCIVWTHLMALEFL